MLRPFYPLKPFIILLVIVVSSFNAAAQSSLFNIPTTDVMPTGEFYAEADFDSHLTGYQSGGYQSYGALTVYGVRKRMEIGLNGYYTKTGGQSQPVELQPNAKWQIYNNEGNGIAVAAGTVLYVPLSRRVRSNTFGSIYGVVSKQIRGSFGPRLTAGGYTLIGRKDVTGSKQGFLLGYEQPLFRRVNFIADWNTGKNRFGYAAAGLGITLSKRSSLYTAYYFGNEGRGNNSLGIYYGYSF